MDDNCGEWVESIMVCLVGAVSRRCMGVASGWNLCVWLQCIGVVSGCCCKEVYRFPHNISYPYNYNNNY